MKNKKSKFLIAVIGLLLIAMVLSGCGAIYRPSSWPGITVSNDGETAFVAYNEKVYALGQNGLQKWAYPNEGVNMNFYAEPLETSDGGLIIGTYDKKLVKLNAETGSMIWEFTEAGNRYIGSAAEADEIIYAPNADEALYVVDMQGNLVWSHETGQANWAAPLVNGSLVYVVSMDHFIYALNRDSHTEAWKTDLGTAAMSSPVFNEDQSVIYLGTYGSKVMALNATTGDVLWETAEDVIPGWVWGSPLFDQGVLYVADSSGTVTALNPQNGVILWQQSYDYPITGSPLLVDGILYVATEGNGDDGGDLIALDAATGVQQWQQRVPGKLYGTPEAFGDMILVGVVEGDNGVILQALNTNGTMRWSFNPGN